MAPPPGQDRARLGGRGTIQFLPDRILIAGKVSQPGRAMLVALAMGIVTYLLAPFIEELIVCGCGLGFIAWLFIFDAVFVKRVTYEVAPRDSGVLFDPHSERASIQLPDARWVTFRLLKATPKTAQDFLAALERHFGPRLSFQELRKYSTGEKIMFAFLGVLLLSEVVIIAVISAS